MLIIVNTFFKNLILSKSSSMCCITLVINHSERIWRFRRFAQPRQVRRSGTVKVGAKLFYSKTPLRNESEFNL